MIKTTTALKLLRLGFTSAGAAAAADQLLSCVRLFVTPWTVAARLLCPWDFPGKNTGVGGHFLLQGIFPTQGLNPHLLLGRWVFYYCATWEAQAENNRKQKCGVEHLLLR